MRAFSRVSTIILAVLSSWAVVSEGRACCHPLQGMGRALFGSSSSCSTMRAPPAPCITGDVAPPPMLYLGPAAPNPAPTPQAPTKTPPVGSFPPPSGKALPAPPTPATDPFGFVPWLNGQRRAVGLALVVYDPTLATFCASNNAVQRARGLGHWVRRGRRQNAAMGAYATVGPMWMASPAHRSALLDPSITIVGFAGDGVWWTFDAS